MGRSPCCSKVGLHRGPWTAKEDMLLKDYITTHGEGHWRNLPKNAGLLRCGKSCRLRWMNYLRPDIKRGNISHDEEELIIRLHSLLGNRWSLIAGRLPGRTDNEIKNFWNTHISKNLRKRGIDPLTHKPIDPQKSHTHSIHLPKPNRLIAFHEANDTHCSSNNEEGKGYENVCCASKDQQNVEAKEIGIDMEEGDCDFMKDFIQNPNISSSSPESIDMNLNMELIAKELEEIDYTALLERYEGKMWDDMLADPQSHTQSLEH